MKKILCILLSIVFLLLLTACNGNYTKIDLKEPIELSKNGIVEKSILEQIKTENAIATFKGESNKIKYEWKIFGRELKSIRDVNLSVTFKNTEKGLKIKFSESEDLGFEALLSVYLNEKWKVENVSALYDGAEVYSVSVTGSEKSILNISIDKIVSECEILPVENKKTEDTTENNSKSSQDTTSVNNTSSAAKPYDNTQSNKKEENSSNSASSDNRIYSNGQNNKDKYETDPVPEGKPLPVEPENQEINKKKKYTCTFSIECSTILNNLSDLDPDKIELVPMDGVILAPTKVIFYESESVFDVLQRVCKENDIHLESSWTPIYNSAYIEGIHNLYEFDCGELSGWMYRVNGWYPNYGCSRYQLADGEVVEWRYTCDLGNDVGGEWMARS